MLQESIFREVFPDFTSHYNHVMSSFITGIYYEYFSENLSDEEFLEVIKKATLEFPVRMKLPSPKEIVELSSQSRKSLAGAEWGIVVKAAINSNPLDKTKHYQDDLAELTDRGHTALAAIGGLTAVAYCEGGSHLLEKRFIEVYCKCSPLEFKRVTPVMPECPPEPDDENDPFIGPEKLSQLRWMIRRMN